ncbi:hypothetical protein [Pilimelia terevasa]|nr:hypothetical protein [Pilimelia terevasa]
MGGFLSPPGDPAHTYRVVTYAGPRSNKAIGLAGLSYAADAANSWIPEHVRRHAQQLIRDADRTPSELWVRHVYGYFRNMWTHDGRPWQSVSSLISGRPVDAPEDHHAACVFVRQFFPDHQPRTDLIADPGKGYGSCPCTKCGQRVQYEARHDVLCVVTTRLTGSGITIWSYSSVCGAGGKHEN